MTELEELKQKNDLLFEKILGQMEDIDKIIREIKTTIYDNK
jgi:hypothetical protein